MQNFYRLLLQIPLTQMGKLSEIYRQNALYLWHLSSVRGISEESLRGNLSVQRKELVLGAVAYMREAARESTVDPLTPTL